MAPSDQLQVMDYLTPGDIDWEREYGLKMKDKAEKHKDQVFQILEQQMRKNGDLEEDETAEAVNENEEIFDIHTDGFQEGADDGPKVNKVSMEDEIGEIQD